MNVGQRVQEPFAGGFGTVRTIYPVAAEADVDWDDPDPPGLDSSRFPLDCLTVVPLPVRPAANKD